MDVEIGEMVSTVRTVDGPSVLSGAEKQKLFAELLALVREELAHAARARAERRIDGAGGTD
jgi:hypothetical protein